MSSANVNLISASELRDKLANHEKLILFDVRPGDMYERWSIDADEHTRKINVAYRELVQKGGKLNPIESIQSAIENDLLSELPEDHEIVTICAKGISSHDVTIALNNIGRKVSMLERGMDGWSELYHFEAVTENDPFSLYQVSRPARGCLSYVLISDGKAIVVDPLRHIDKYLDFVNSKNAQIHLVLDTHGHADHISGGRALADNVGVPYFLHPYDGIHPIDVLPAQIEYENLRDGQLFAIGDLKMVALHVPGHTLGNIAFWVNEQYLLCGDSIFINSIARPDLGGHGKTWAPIHFKSLKRLLELPSETLVLPGHFSSPSELNEGGLYAATLGELAKNNEGLIKVLEGKEAFVSYILASLPEFPDQYIEMKRVNAGLSSPDESTSSELELGKNICALAKV